MTGDDRYEQWQRAKQACDDATWNLTVATERCAWLRELTALLPPGDDDEPILAAIGSITDHDQADRCCELLVLLDLVPVDWGRGRT